MNEIDTGADLTSAQSTIADDCIIGVAEIADFLGKPWTLRRVRYARETGALPIRAKRSVGVYAFKSELWAALRGQDSLPPKGK